MDATRRFTLAAVFVVLALAATIAGVVLMAEPRALSVLEVRPPDGAVDVPRSTQVTVTFSRPLDEASVRAGLAVTPPTEGFVSVAGRRAAFTPRVGLRGETGYTITLGRGIRDRSGRTLARAAVSRFRTQPLALILRTPDGRLRRSRIGGGPEPLADVRVEAFAVSPAGRLAYVRADDQAFVVERPGAPSEPVALPGGLEVREIEWVPGDTALLLLGARAGALGVPYIVRLAGGTPTVEPFGPRPGPIDVGSVLLAEALKKSLVEIVYGRESFALTPDGRAAIVRDEGWDFAVIGLDGVRRAILGPYLAVGNVAPRGDALVVVDVNPADPTLRRQVLVRGSGGRTRLLSAPERDSHSPRFAPSSDRVVYVTGDAVGLPRERRFALELVDLPSGSRRPLTDPPRGESDDGPQWAPDEAWISFRRGPVGAPDHGTVWLVSPDGGPARRLVPTAAEARWLP